MSFVSPEYRAKIEHSQPLPIEVQYNTYIHLKFEKPDLDLEEDKEESGGS